MRSIGSPATAKNVLTVGASENDQSHDTYQPSTTCSGMCGDNLLGTCGQRRPAGCLSNPKTPGWASGALRSSL